MSESNPARNGAKGDNETGESVNVGNDRAGAASRGRYDTDQLDREELERFVDRILAQNQQLQAEQARVRGAAYRRTALALAAVGLVTLGVAVVVPSERTVLLALGGTGVFAGILTYYFTPEALISAQTGARLQATVAENRDRLTEQLGLSNRRVYVPNDGPTAAMLFVPQHSVYEIPPDDAFAQPLVVTANDRERGLSLVPMGDSLLGELERSTSSVAGKTPANLVSLLAEAITDTFELADRLTADIDSGGGQLTFTVHGCVWGDVGQLDHPVASFLAVCVATGLGVPVELTVEPLDELGEDAHVVLQWDSTEA